MAGHGIGPRCRRCLAAALQLIVTMAERIDIRIEDPGDSAEIEVVELRVTAGDRVTKGSVLLEVATDKANVEIEAPRDGVVEKLMVAKGDIVKVDRILAVLLS
jgi:pyruvate/2-oxoglutarate dehydrogenase complex dihydrolipoamide acyltransferase (E2) component